MTLRKRIAGLVFLLLISTALWIGFSKLFTSTPRVTFTTITGKKISLNDLRGKPVIVTFWATDCPGCIREIPHLIDLYSRYHALGLEIIAVAMYYDPPSHVVAMSRDQQLPYDVALDLKSEHARAFGDVRLTPTTFLIASDGSIALQKIGAFEPADMKTRIEKLLKG
ncbi:Peroxiredoxin [Candidatus Methylobacter favarea]|uniref:Peroxiredoxin n=1 Tax=Candidatus Methylobacter favarea TaxID=2707345 RepID=A0A8S0XE01_9GAMM|nr:TlpA disulfide reductase family protein [Candidatus Methylobacter favarea]CAA9889342.1 Peroxiredoxin [Candidatus Methylobacter favarea]